MCLISPNEHVGVGSRFLARIGAGDSMRNTAVRLGFEGRNRGREGGLCLDGRSVGAGAFFSNCRLRRQGVNVEGVLAAVCMAHLAGVGMGGSLGRVLHTCTNLGMLQYTLGQRWAC